jgi:hypothetical protein
MYDIAEKRSKEPKGPRKDMLKGVLVSCFGKTIENKENYINVKVHSKSSAYEKFATSRYCTDYFLQDLEKDDDNNIVSFLGLTKHLNRRGIALDKPRCIGWCVLELSKAAMMKFHFQIMKSVADQNRWRLSLVYTDTDSLFYLIEGKVSPLDALRACNLDAKRRGVFQPFDLSSRGECENAGRLHTFKLEYSQDPTEGVFLAPKLYALKFVDEKFEMKAKGVGNEDMKRVFTFNSYRDMLYNISGGAVDLVEMRSRNHKVLHHTFTKQALTAFTDKVITVSATRSVPFGYQGTLGTAEEESFKLDDITDGALDCALAQLGAQRGIMWHPKAETEDLEEIASNSSEREVEISCCGSEHEVEISCSGSEGGVEICSLDSECEVEVSSSITGCADEASSGDYESEVEANSNDSE